MLMSFLYFDSYLFHSVLKTNTQWVKLHVTELCFCGLQYGMGGSGGSKASFTPFVDPRVYGTSPTDDDDNNSASGTSCVWKWSHWADSVITLLNPNSLHLQSHTTRTLDEFGNQCMEMWIMSKKIFCCKTFYVSLCLSEKFKISKSHSTELWRACFEMCSSLF